jgi:hypothetical protein
MSDLNNLSFDLPINAVSFGSVSIAILREFQRRGVFPNVFPLMGQRDLSAQRPDPEFDKWLSICVDKSQISASRKHTSIRLWHMAGSLQSYSAVDSRLITFHETDQLTSHELNILRNQERVYVTSQFTKTVFEQHGIAAEYLPLGFDAHNFRALEKRPKIDGVTQWMLCGKWESRKGHAKILAAWAKKYGNRNEHRLNMAVHNPFFHQDPQQSWNLTLAEASQALGGQRVWNVNPIPFMGKNEDYSAFLQGSDIILGLSGGEGRDLPVYQATALGAWPVALKAHAYTDYLNDENAILVPISGKRPAADGRFFHANSPFNVGNFFDFDEAAFNVACEEAERRVKTGINKAGLKLQDITYANTVDVLIKDLK